MSIRPEDIKDPKLRAQVLAALGEGAAGKQGMATMTKSSSHGPPAPARRIRQDTKPLLNKLETEFRSMWLNEHAGCHLLEQSIRFRLGNGIWYKPDFVWFPPMSYIRPHAYEVKGPHAFRGGFENLKVAAGMYTEVQFILCWKEDGVWKEQRVLP